MLSTKDNITKRALGNGSKESRKIDNRITTSKGKHKDCLEKTG